MLNTTSLAYVEILILVAGYGGVFLDQGRVNVLYYLFVGVIPAQAEDTVTDIGNVVGQQLDAVVSYAVEIGETLFLEQFSLIAH